MKKRILSGLLCVFVAATMISGCAKSDKEKEKESQTEASDEEVSGPRMPSLDGIDLEKSITLGEYNGITVEKKVTQVTDENIDSEITYALSTSPIELTDENAKVEEGDTVNIDYVGKVDGKEFDGGSAEGSDLTIGSGQFIEGFEDGLVGTTKGQTVELDLTFPEDYSEELGGKDVVFTVTINAIKRPATEISDEWVAANSEFKTVDEYRAGIRKDLEDYYESQATESLSTTAWQQVVSASTINEYPEELLDYGKEVFESQIKTYADYSSQTIDEYIEAQGVSKEDYEAQKETYGQNVAAQMLVMKAIADKEGFSTDDKEYKEALDGYLEQYSMTEDELYKQYGEESVYQSIMLQRVTNFIVDNAEIKEVAADADTGSDAEQADDSAADKSAEETPEATEEAAE
ncbi:trigger factor [Ruminococcus sp. OA3]|uniref:trigger factor n=1 Tax=Ruminococcus sp. OA3 TaxID=2914164 RepID=UPI001F065E3B|nr:trigger factor [Ruminococcus sp. OA3]MCH1981330.1 trigger factor [Ruminococcus sp. OA3]